jgi:hypothetical protein
MVKLDDFPVYVALSGVGELALRLPKHETLVKDHWWVSA